MDYGDAKAKHLEMIQAIVTRMGGNLFYLKGWTITIVAGLFALGAKDSNPKLIVIAFVPLLVFWTLDGYFLSQERLFRSLYDTVRQKANADIDFSMDTTPLRSARNTWRSAMFSKTLILFYGPILVLTLGLTYYILR